MNKLIYTGVGSRNTPSDVMQLMLGLGKQLSNNWILRSGHADGADLAFELGCAEERGYAEIYVPWVGFNNSLNKPPFYVPNGAIAKEAEEIAARLHGGWHNCSAGARKLHTRNVFQVLGMNLDEPSHMLVCWTKNGSGTGGTGLAIKVAREFNVPVFDLYTQQSRDDLKLFIAILEDQFFDEPTKVMNY